MKVYQLLEELEDWLEKKRRFGQISLTAQEVLDKIEDLKCKWE